MPKQCPLLAVPYLGNSETMRSRSLRHARLAFHDAEHQSGFALDRRPLNVLTTFVTHRLVHLLLQFWHVLSVGPSFIGAYNRIVGRCSVEIVSWDGWRRSGDGNRLGTADRQQGNGQACEMA